MTHPSTLLIVDDHAANRDTLVELLENTDYRLVEAANGLEALKLAAQLLPDLILLDVLMPEMDGFEVCRRLRADPKLAEVPVIMVTALDDQQARIMGIGCGADDFVSKPYDRSELRVRVKTITRLNRYGRLLRERAKVEEASQKIREQAALIDLATDAIGVLDTEARVPSWNPGAETIFGTAAPEAHGRPRASLISQGEPQRLESALAETLRQGEWRGILTVSTDQTEFKKLQAQFYRAQRMESLGALAGGIAHDLNNVLAPVLMAAEMLQAGPPAEIQLELAKVIQTSAECGAGLVRQILAFARGSDGQERIELQPSHLIRDAVVMVKETFPKAMEIRSELDAELFVVRADPTQIHQVLLNLLVNARDAMNGTGKLTVAAENRVLDAAFASQKPGATAGPHVVLRVTDTGSGMTPEVLAKIWNPFFTTKPPGKGTGIGLATVANIVKEHGGFVEVTSKPGAGTTFAIYLPATSGTAASACWWWTTRWRSGR